MSNRWTGEELRAIAAARELEIQSMAADGRLRKAVTIWVVRQGEDLYVRSWRGPGSAWFRGLQARHEGHIRAGGIDKDVTFAEAPDQPVNASIDVAYRAKYGDSPYARAMVSEPARSTTIRLVPR